MRKRLLTFTTILAVFLATAPNIQADETTEQAKVIFQKGLNEYLVGNFEGALKLYLEALKLARRPSIMLNVAQSYRMLERPQKAIFFYKLYLGEYARTSGGKTSPYKKEIEDYIAGLNAQLQSTKTQKAATAPKPATTQPTAEVKDAKAPPSSQPVTVIPADSSPTPSDVPTADRPPETESAPPTTPTTQAPRRRIWTWVSLGLTVACAGTAVGLWFSSASDENDAAQLKQSDPRWQELNNQIATKDLATNIVGFGLTSAFAITSVVLYFLEGRPGEVPAVTTARSWTLSSVGDAGVSLSLPF